jgi:hypothetical protein
MYIPTREWTNRMLEAVDEGLLDKDQVILACLNWMTDDDVKKMAEANEFFENPDDNDDDDDLEDSSE